MKICIPKDQIDIISYPKMCPFCNDTENVAEFTFLENFSGSKIIRPYFCAKHRLLLKKKNRVLADIYAAALLIFSPLIYEIIIKPFFHDIWISGMAIFYLTGGFFILFLSLLPVVSFIYKLLMRRILFKINTTKSEVIFSNPNRKWMESFQKINSAYISKVSKFPF